MARILNRPLPDEAEFQALDFPHEQWKQSLAPELSQKRKILLTRFFFSDVPDLEALAQDYTVSFAPRFPGSPLGKVYLTPK